MTLKGNQMASRKRSVKAFKAHAFLAIFPEMSEADYAALRLSIETDGQLVPIIADEATIIDGRARLRACVELGIEPRFAEYDGPEDVGAYIVASNLHRRHLTESQRQLVAARLATLKQGKPANVPDNGGAEIPTQGEAASMLAVSERGVRAARKVLESGDEELIKAIESGSVTIGASAGLLKRPEDERKAVLELVAGGKTLPAAMRELAQEGKPELSVRGEFAACIVDPGGRDELAGVELPIAEDGHLFVWAGASGDDVRWAIKECERRGFRVATVFAAPLEDERTKHSLKLSLEFCIHATRGRARLSGADTYSTMLESREDMWSLMRDAIEGPKLDLLATVKVDGFESGRLKAKPRRSGNSRSAVTTPAPISARAR